MKTFLTYTTALIVGLSASTLAFGGGKGGSGKGHSSHSGSVSHGSHSHSWNYNHSSGSNHGSKLSYHSKVSTFHNYHLTHGKKFSKGYCYPGKYHKHWSYCCFNKLYGCYLYWCPCTTCWYYYCVPDCCYYPVCYVPYQCYCWGVSVAYCSAPCPPADVVVPDPVEVLEPEPR
jgi:hypothetical protein